MNTGWQSELSIALNANDVGAARRILARELQQHPDNRAAWRELAAIVTDPAQRAECLRRAQEPATSPAIAERWQAAPPQPASQRLGRVQLIRSSAPQIPAPSTQSTPALKQPVSLKPLSMPALQPVRDSQPAVVLPQPAPKPARSPLALALIAVGLMVFLSGVGLFAYMQYSTPVKSYWKSHLSAFRALKITAPKRDVLVEQADYTQMERRVLTYGIVRNPSAVALSHVPYTITLTLRNAVARQFVGDIPLLLPQQTLAVASSYYLPEGAHVTAVDVIVGAAAVYPLQPPLTLPDVAGIKLGSNVFGDEQRYTIQSTITNSNTQNLGGVRLIGLVFDQDHKLVAHATRLLDGTLGTNDQVLNIQAEGQAEQRGATAQVYVALEPNTFAPHALTTEAVEGSFNYGETIPDAGRLHAQMGTTVKYNSVPPTSGKHYGQLAEWKFYYDYEPIDNEYVVHNMEHGAVVLHYNPKLMSYAETSDLFDVYAELSAVNYRIIAKPNEELPTKIALASWNYRLFLNEVDPTPIREFYHAHIARGPECVNKRCP